jgi:ATP-dependent Clp protease ATP-binding subunit ClpA
MGKKDVKVSTKKMISEVKKEIINHNIDQISVEAILVGMLSAGENSVIKTFTKMGVDVNKLHDVMYEAAFNNNLTPKILTVKNPVYSKELKDVFRQVDHECDKLGALEIDSIHIILSILHIKPKVNKILSHFSIYYENFKQAFMSIHDSDEIPSKGDKPTPPIQTKTSTKTSTPALDNFSRNLTEGLIHKKRASGIKKLPLIHIPNLSMNVFFLAEFEVIF